MLMILIMLMLIVFVVWKLVIGWILLIRMVRCRWVSCFGLV